MLGRQTIGKYDIIKEVGRGNMATVYLGHDAFNSRDVALKVAHPEILRDEVGGSRFREMFFHEAKVAGMLKHPNIAAIYDAGVEGDVCYIAMEYVPGGETLKTHCTPEHLLPIEDVAQIIFKCAKSLDHAHRRGVIHRDIKPANVLITDDRDVKIVDFGIALLTRTEDTRTQIQGYVGSPLYMSPEQVRQEVVTSQTDLFSLGVVLYELLTGQHPFRAENLAAIVHNIADEPYAPVREYRSTVPEIMERILRRALMKNPGARYKTGLDLAADMSLLFDALALTEEDLSDREEFNMVRDLAFFKTFSEPEIWEVIHASKWLEFQPGTVIVKEGELDSAFYVIVSGDAVVHTMDTEIGRLKQGECFGEMGFITRETRSATVTAATDVHAMKVSASLIERASLNCQLRFHKVFLNTLVGRLRDMNARVAG